MKGHVFKRCQCIAQYDTKGRRKNCKKAHGSWYYAADTGIEKDGKRQQQEGRVRHGRRGRARAEHGPRPDQ
ncbi:hypothetical protein ACFXPV_01735 [Streptomyces sp. NPDC059118]|uniref:hypothetical protein n=1 Tax=unclassified Streptomyces TaxID=2593676 RepID=UPI0036AF674C